MFLLKHASSGILRHALVEFQNIILGLYNNNKRCTKNFSKIPIIELTLQVGIRSECRWVVGQRDYCTYSKVNE